MRAHSHSSKDLDTALLFVRHQIEAAASRTGYALTDDERDLLHDLPTTPLFPQNEDFLVSIPRDVQYERLISLAKEAYKEDARTLPNGPADWKFALAVLRLNRHPMAWLLEWAGIKVRMPLWDRFLLVLAAVIVVAGGLTVFALTTDQAMTSVRFIAGASAGVALVSGAYLWSRNSEQRQLKKAIEKYRYTTSLRLS